jgi:hypothetical protein
MNGKHRSGFRSKNDAARRSVLIASILVIAAVVLVGFATLAYNKPAATIPTREAAEPIASTRKNSRLGGVAVQIDTPAVEVEVVVLTPEGFQPSQISRPIGPFILQVDNRTGMEQIEVTIFQPGGGMVDRATIGSGQIDWNSEYDLSPGSYTLSVTGHPEWICPITISNLN